MNSLLILGGFFLKAFALNISGSVVVPSNPSVLSVLTHSYIIKAGTA